MRGNREYFLSEDELGALNASLEKAGYKMRAHIGTADVTIAKRDFHKHDECKQISVLTYLAGGNSFAKLEVSDSDLENTVDSIVKDF